MAGETLLNTKVTTSSEDTSKIVSTSEVAQLTKEQTNIIDNSGKRIFRNSIPMSSFIFPTGKVIYFRGGVYGTDKPEEIAELEKAAKVNPLITEVDEAGNDLYSPEDKLREQAKNILD